MLGPLTLALLVSTAPAPSCATELFRIGRSTNANEVVYLARRGARRGARPRRPAGGGVAHAGRGRPPGGAQLHREAPRLRVQRRPGPVGRRVRRGPEGQEGPAGEAHAARRLPGGVVTIAGRPALLRRIFVQAEESDGIIPSVAWADLEGVDPAPAPRSPSACSRSEAGERPGALLPERPEVLPPGRRRAPPATATTSTQARTRRRRAAVST